MLTDEWLEASDDASCTAPNDMDELTAALAAEFRRLGAPEYEGTA